MTAALAPRREGKTIIVLDIGLCVASGLPWCGEPIIGEWTVAYLCGEDVENTAAHVRAWCQEYSDGLLPERFHFVKDVPNLLALKNCDVDGLIEAMRPHVPDGGRVLWIMDTWQRATTAGSQNDDAHMKPAFRNMEILAREYDGAAISCFHPPKGDSRTISGVLFQENAASAMWRIEKADPEAVDSERKLIVDNIKGDGGGNFKLFRFEKITLETRKITTGETVIDYPVVGVFAKHNGGTGEPKETTIERVMMEQAKYKDAVDIVFEMVKGLLAAGKRVLNQNRSNSDAVQLKELVRILEADFNFKVPGKSARAKGQQVRQYLDTLTGRADGRLEWRGLDKHGHGKASYFLTDKGAK